MASNIDTVNLNATHVEALRNGVYTVLHLPGLADHEATQMACQILQGLLHGPLVGEVVEHESGLPGLSSSVTRDKTATVNVAPGLPARFLAAAVSSVLVHAPKDMGLATYSEMQDLYRWLTDLALQPA
ncbi:MAG: hypothetical protein JNL87_13005 [Burkholderiaceae bacterium]|nr:hypothetical protein [Burkholderiaceae bacterium]